MMVFHILWQKNNKNFLLQNDLDSNKIKNYDKIKNIFLYIFPLMNFGIYG